MQNPVVEKIRKLLRLAHCKGASPAEAAAALSKAMQLAAEHGIDLSKIPADGSANGGTTHTTEPSQKGPAHRLASWIVKRHFSVATLFDSTGPKPLIHFIGIETNCQLARYCFVFLVRSSRAAWRKRANRRLRDRESFLNGYFHAIDRLMPEVFHRDGLILSTEGYIETVILAGKEGVKLSQIKPKDRDLSPAAFTNGLRAGQQTGIHNAIRGTDKNLLS